MNHDDSLSVDIIGAESLDRKESELAKSYWSNRTFDYYKTVKSWSEFVAEEIVLYDPASVFEFGCSVGKNLIEVRRRRGDVFLSGVDINGPAVEFGRAHHGLRLMRGDESVLEIVPDGSFDVTFTVSVLDHLPQPGPVLASLGRVSRKAVLLLELFAGKEGKVVRNRDRRSGQRIETTPYSYSWDYEGLISQWLPTWQYEVRDFPIDSNLGRYYKYFKIVRPGKMRAH